jgi:hypothetical protein
VSGHRFKIGQLENYYLSRESASGLHQITQLLPAEDAAFRYRIKNASEPHEHVTKENECALLELAGTSTMLSPNPALPGAG